MDAGRHCPHILRTGSSAIVSCMPRIFFAIVLALSVSLPAFAKDKQARPAPFNNTRGDKWAEKTLRNLSVEEKIGQVFMIWCRASFLNVESPEYLQWLEAMQKYHVGSFTMSVHVDGPFLLRTEPYEVAELLNRLQRESKLPLLFAADFERGARHAPAGRDGLSSRHGLRCRWQHRRRGDVRPHHRPGSASHRRSLEFLSGRRRELESCQSHHQHALLRRRSQAGRRSGHGLHQRRARGGNADHGETLSRARRYGYRFASRRRQRERRPRSSGFDRASTVPSGHRCRASTL